VDSEQILSVVELELAEGVDNADFERFAVQEYLPAVAALGVRLSLLRGIRGERDQSYLLIEVFDSIEHRNRLFPGSETPSPEVSCWVETHQALVTTWNARIASARMTHYEVRGTS
jgi:hypothetical protein